MGLFKRIIGLVEVTEDGETVNKFKVGVLIANVGMFGGSFVAGRKISPVRNFIQTTVKKLSAPGDKNVTDSATIAA